MEGWFERKIESGPDCRGIAVGEWLGLVAPPSLAWSFVKLGPTSASMEVGYPLRGIGGYWT